MFCGYCGKELPEGAIRCDGCGKKVGGGGLPPVIFVVIAALAIIAIVAAGVLINNSSRKKQEEERAERIRIEEEQKAQEEAAAEQKAKEEAEAAKKAEEERLAAEAEKKRLEDEAKAAAEAEAASYDSDLEMISDGVLVEIAKNLREDKDKEALSLMFSDEFKGLAGKIAADTETDRYIYTTEYGDIAVFRADGKANSDLGNTFVYYGRFKNRQRSGDAWWLEVDPEANAMSFSLSFEDDLPEGEFTRYSYPVGNGDISGDYELTATGSVIHGLFDGDIKWVMSENGEESVTTYEMGDEAMKITDFDPEIQEMDTPDGPIKGYMFMTSDGENRFILASEVESAGGPEAYMEKNNSGSVKIGILGGHE